MHSQGNALEVDGLSVFYGPIPALTKVGLTVPPVGIRVLLGANGAGKSSTLRAISGLLRPRTGTVTLDGRAVTHMSAERRVALGLALVADDRLLFPSLTVQDNLRAGGYRTRRREAASRLELIYTLLPVLAQRRSQAAGSLSGGQAQMLAIGRALMSQPKVLLLDEPSQGLAPKVVDEMFSLIQNLTENNSMSILLAEQNANLGLDFASYGYVLENGRLGLEGPTSELRGNQYVQKLYLGG